MKGSANPFPHITLVDTVDPTAPADGTHLLFVDTDEKLKMIDHASLVTDFTPGAGGSVATDTIWDAAGDLAVGSGANTAGKLSIGAAGGALSVINSAVAWNSGTSMPANKATGDRYWRTDLGLEFYWDGTRWLTTTLFAQHLTPLLAVTDAGISATATYARCGTWVGMGDLWLVDWVQHSRVLNTNDGSKYWTFDLSKFTQAVSATALDSFTTAAHTAGNMVTTVRTLGALIGTTNTTLQIVAQKTSSPGNLVADSGTVRFRIVGT